MQLPTVQAIRRPVGSQDSQRTKGAGMENIKSRINNLIGDLAANHKAIGRDVTVYSQAIEIIEQLQAALAVTVESRGVIQSEWNKMKRKLDSAQSIASNGWIEAWYCGNQFMALPTDNYHLSVMRCWQESKTLEALRRL